MPTAAYLREWKANRPPAATEGTKVCSGCEKERHVTDFWKHKGGALGRSNLCIICQKDRQWWASVLSLYGLTREEYEAMAAKGCAICGSTDPLSHRKNLPVDHCHKTGVTRGVLCNNCNLMLGLVHDDPAILRRAAEYLERP